MGLFTEKSEISHRRSRYADLSDAEIVRQIRDEAQLLLEHHSMATAALPQTAIPADVGNLQPCRTEDLWFR